MILAEANIFTKLHFRMLERTSPKASARKALKLWLTPGKYKPGAPERLTLEQATVRRILFKDSPYQASPETYYTSYTWGSGPTVLLVHDWGGSAAQVAALARPLVQAGFRVVAFDALAHGDSPGKRTDLVEFVDVIKNLHQQFGPFYAVFAFSLGAVATVMALQDGVRASRLVVAGAAASVDYYLKRFTQTIEVSRQTMGRISTLINTRLERNIKDFSIINIVPNLNVPGLILHDKHDEVVNYIEAIALSKLWPMSELHLTEGLGHRGMLRGHETILTIVSYLRRTGAPSNSAKEGPRIQSTGPPLAKK